MKKQRLCALLCAAMMLASSLPAFAAKPVLEELPVEPTENGVVMEQMVMLQFVDKEGNPVQGLSVSDSNHYIFTDHDGLSDIDVDVATGAAEEGVFAGENKVDFSKTIAFSATNPVTGETKKYNVLLSETKITQLLWDRETPAQSLEKKKEKVFFRVIDQNGKPLTDVRIVLPLQQILLPTNTDGKTYYYGEPFEKYSINLFYKDAKGNDQYTSKLVTVREKHLKNGKMGITFKVTI